MTSIVVVSAGLSNPSSTRLLADRLAAATLDALAQVRSGVSGEGAQAEVTHIELRQLAHQLTDQLLTGFAGPELAAAQAAVRSAAGLIVVTPVFAASYSGLFKTFFDVLDPEALDGTPVLIAATAGTPRHSLVLDHALRPLFSYLHAVVLPTGVFAATDDFAGNDLAGRIRRGAGELAAALAGQGTVARSTPRRRTVEDELVSPTPFEELLQRVSIA